jgi:hypothetical protein
MNLQCSQRESDPRTSERAAELEAYSHCRLGGRVRDFRLDVVNQAVVVRGRAQSYHAKQLAQKAVMEMTDLPILANEIEVF